MSDREFVKPMTIKFESYEDDQSATMATFVFMEPDEPCGCATSHFETEDGSVELIAQYEDIVGEQWDKPSRIYIHDVEEFIAAYKAWKAKP